MKCWFWDLLVLSNAAVGRETAKSWCETVAEEGPARGVQISLTENICRRNHMS